MGIDNSQIIPCLGVLSHKTQLLLQIQLYQVLQQVLEDLIAVRDLEHQIKLSHKFLLKEGRSRNNLTDRELQIPTTQNQIKCHKFKIRDKNNRWPFHLFQ